MANESFKKELAELLKKHNAHLSVDGPDQVIQYDRQSLYMTDDVEEYQYIGDFVKDPYHGFLFGHDSINQ